MSRRRSSVLVALAAVAMLVVGCSDGDDSAGGGDDTTTTTDATTTSAAAEVLTVLVSNDDGYDAEGIDAVVRALSELPDTEVVVAAPAENQSGSGSQTTEGELETAEVETLSGHPATAVTGFPADSVNWALDGGIDVTPDVVITGINEGQNLGYLGDQVSGTVGAARAAAAQGIPALAASSAENEATDYDLAAEYVVDWVQEHREALLAGELTGTTLLLQNLNIPACTAGELRGLLEVPMSSSPDGAYEDPDCTSTLEDPADDIAGFNNGFVVISDLTLEPAAA
jgi:5'-nucleotidase